MDSHASVAVVGGGVVGCSILYHLAKMGREGCVLLERLELTSGSSWHAAGGFHNLNSDPYVARLQSYTIDLYRELEEATGDPLTIHRTGGVFLAASEARRDFLKNSISVAKTIGIEMREMPLDELRERAPVLNLDDVLFVAFDPQDGHLDPSQATGLYAKAARALGAKIETHAKVESLERAPGGGWLVHTGKGTLKAETVVNAGGLWGREVGRMAGAFVPIQPMEHHYMVTEPMPELEGREEQIVHIIDFEGETYARQEGAGMLLGIYERGCVPWQPKATPWDFGPELLADDMGRLADRLEGAYRRYPALEKAGIKRIVNGPFAFAGDGNPVIGPVPGIPDYFVACGVMAGFSQAGGVGRSIAEWIVDGEPSTNTLAMDVSRYGAWADQDFATAKSMENYSRRFQITYPNEELPAGRPVRTMPIHEELRAAGAVFTFAFGLECPAWFAASPEEAREEVGWGHTNAHPRIALEARAVRDSAGLSEVAIYGRHGLSGPGAEALLRRLTAVRMPPVGRLALAPVLSPKGRLIGDLSVARLAEDDFLLVGSRAYCDYHRRWLLANMPESGVDYRPLTDEMSGVMISGPRAREALERIVEIPVGNDDLPFLSARRVEAAGAPAVLLRVSFTGELGYELHAAEADLPRLFRAAREATEAVGGRLVGTRAVLSLRMEKGFGSWSREFTPAQTAAESGLDRFVDKGRDDFVGAAAAAAERARGPARRLRLFEIDVEDMDAQGNEPILRGGAVVGFVTSGDRGHTCGKSLALGYVESEALAGEPTDGWTIEVLGEPRAARMPAEPPVDPSGSRMRSLCAP